MMIDIPTLVDIKKQENEIIAQKEAEQLATQKFFIEKTQKGIDNLINACLEKAKKGKIKFEHRKFIHVIESLDALPSCVDSDTIHTIARELRKAGYDVKYEMDVMMTSDFSQIQSLIITW